jgi:hypothetical protein
MKKHPNEDKYVSVLRKKAQQFLDRKGVTSVGVGYRIRDGRPTRELCIQFTVEEKRAPEALAAEGIELLPATIADDDGAEIPVDVIERSYDAGVTLLREAEALTPRQARRSRIDPLRPGASVGFVRGTAGTIGGFVYDRDSGEPLILSNWHVLHGPDADIGGEILQPGPFDGGSTGEARVGKLVRSHLGLAGDCALATIEDRGVDPSVIELDVVPRRIGKVNLGDKVVKSGRTTGVTFGVVRRVGVVAKLNYGTGFEDQQIGGFEIGPNNDKPAADGEISKGGDSGSYWMMDEPGLADVVVGLHFAGETDPAPEAEHALACNIHSVLEKLHVRLAPPEELAAPGMRAYRAMGLRGPAVEQADGDPPPLNEETLPVLEQMLETAPDELMARLRANMDPKMTEEEFRHHLARVRAALADPRMFAPQRAPSIESLRRGLPDDFTFPGMNLEEIPIDPNNHQFETVGDLFGWVAFAAYPAIFPADKADFRDHERLGATFEYPLPEPGADSPLDVALFADFGTGLYHSRYIAKQFRERKYPCAIHLGDVYYAGRSSEFRDNFIAPLEPSLSSTALFMLNSNHEMYSGGRWYFDFIERKREGRPNQVQEGSYFSLTAGPFQIVGVDTAYHEHGRVAGARLLEWARRKLSQGRADGRINILLSADHPYEYGESGITKLLSSDFLDSANNGLIDLWFWGNTHYCGLFDRGPRTPFIGTCIGHGGYPYSRQRSGRTCPAPVRFLETQARFPESTRIRQDMGNNGYCQMSLAKDGTITLRYIDWMSRTRCTATLARASSSEPLAIRSVMF